MKLLVNKPGVEAATTPYPYGKSKDNTGSNDGFPLNSENLEDYHQFFARMFAMSGLTANGLPDNVTNGFQLYEAFRKLTRPYKLYAGLLNQNGTAAAPTFTTHFSDFGTIVWSRSSAGVYAGTLVGAFAGKRGLLVAQPSNPANAIAWSSTDDEILIYSNVGGSPADGLTNIYLEFKIFD